MRDSRQFFDHLRALVNSGALTYEEAKVQAAPRLEEMNSKGREVAKKYGKKFRPFTFAALMR